MDFICPYTCSYRTNIGYCGSTGGWERCQFRQLHQPNTVVGYVPPLKKTNADRIRAKSDEELATWVETIAGCDLCPMLDEQCSGGEINSRASCKRHWLEWLGQEAT